MVRPQLKTQEAELPDDGSFGWWLRTARNAKGYTLQNLADVAKTVHSSVSRLENNRAKPSRKMIERLATALDVDQGEQDEGLRRAGFIPEEGAVPMPPDAIKLPGNGRWYVPPSEMTPMERLMIEGLARTMQEARDKGLLQEPQESPEVD